MRCPSCGHDDWKVIDSRPVEENNSIKRRRECLSCHMRFTTYEIIDQTNPVVLKKDGSRELFDKNKLAAGLYKACEKRPVDAKAVADEIEASIQASMKSEITSVRIGEMAMEKLRQLDPVAYVRFASVHREFKDIDTFMREISELKQEEEKNRE
ncbi:MAG: transcriptional regulator NrdR [Clostridiales bacterium]|nr:transcriptional repressor NrdR [Clostridia bacterium]MBR5367235.1 transcriptional repressor NrdR [Clostridia bacterium]MCR5681518.1 transcriptional regulator NrdR [Clostridiales bacterium]